MLPTSLNNAPLSNAPPSQHLLGLRLSQCLPRNHTHKHRAPPPHPPTPLSKRGTNRPWISINVAHITKQCPPVQRPSIPVLARVAALPMSPTQRVSSTTCRPPFSLCSCNGVLHDGLDKILIPWLHAPMKRLQSIINSSPTPYKVSVSHPLCVSLIQ